jgi:hypothetical protein
MNLHHTTFHINIKSFKRKILSNQTQQELKILQITAFMCQTKFNNLKLLEVELISKQYSVDIKHIDEIKIKFLKVLILINRPDLQVNLR